MVKTRVGAGGGRWGYIRGWYGGLSPGELFPGGVSPRIILEGLVEGRRYEWYRLPSTSPLAF